MLKNYFKIAMRMIVRNKLYSLINILGLTLGIVACILIFLFVRSELSYDQFHPDADRMYRVYVTEAPEGRDPFSYSLTPGRMGEAMKNSFPEVEDVVRAGLINDLVRYDNVTFRERVHIADANFFEFFNFPLVHGNPATVLKEKNTVVITEEMATKYFGNEDAAGQVISIKSGDEDIKFTVTGVARNIPENSSIQFDFVIPFENIHSRVSDQSFSNWFSIFLETWVRLKSPLNAKVMEEKLQAVATSNYPPEDAEIVTLHLQPITDIHLNKDIPPGFEPTSDPVYSYILSATAILILTIACINFTTLAIGYSVNRSREVGVRKVLGAMQSQLIRQFWGEAILMSFLALLSGLLLSMYALPWFNELANRNLALSFDFTMLLMAIGLMLVVGIAAGSYPALVLARTQPAIAMKSGPRIGGTSFFGRSLVIFQFVLSIFLIVCTLVINNQLHYLRAKNLGFNQEDVVVLRNSSLDNGGHALVERLRNVLSGHPEFLNVSGSSNTFASIWAQMGFPDENNAFRQFFQQTVDFNYLETMQVELVEGRGFSLDFSTDSSEAIVVNEALVKYFGWTDPIGRKLPGRDFPPHKIIGVTKDFHFEPLQNEISPLVLCIDPTPILRGINDINAVISPRTLNFINIRYRTSNLPEFMAQLEDTWHTVAPGQPFNFSFLDKDIEQQYLAEERWESIARYATFLAIVIACLGLVGLAALTTTKRTREIGIRKVLGASVTSIVKMICIDFARLIVLANIIAWPLAWFAMESWLQDFAFHVEIGWQIFVMTGIASLVLALLAVSSQTLRPAFINPVSTLRSE